MNWELYKVFYYVANFGSISRAAEAMDFSQPSVTRCIHALEQELGCTLFIRGRRGVTMTNEAVQLYPFAERMMQQAVSAQQMINGEEQLKSGTLFIGAGENTLQNYLLPHIRRFRDRYPGVRLKIHTESTPSTVSQLLNEAVDIAVVTSPVAPDTRLEITKLAPVQDIAIAGVNFEGLRGKVLSFTQLAQLPLVMLAEGTTTREFINEYFASAGSVPEADIEVKTLDLVTPVVENGLGVGFVTAEFAGKALEEGRVFRLRLEREIPQRYVCMLHNPARPMMPAAKKFAEMLMQDG